MPHVVVLDLEDAVPPAGKSGARRLVREAAARLGGSCAGVRPRQPARARPGSPTTSHRYPRGCRRSSFRSFSPLLKHARCAGRSRDGPSSPVSRPSAGSCDARELLDPPVVACYFGAEDYVADLGGVRTAANDEVSVPTVLGGHGGPAGRRYRRSTWSPCDFGDDERFAREAREARALGYAGKMCIHPAPGAVGQRRVPPLAPKSWTGPVASWRPSTQAAGATIAFEGLDGRRSRRGPSSSHPGGDGGSVSPIGRTCSGHRPKTSGSPPSSAGICRGCARSVASDLPPTRTCGVGRWTI